MRNKYDYTIKSAPHMTVPVFEKALTQLRKILPNYTTYQIRTIAVFFFLQAIRPDSRHAIVQPDEDVEAKLEINTKL